MRLIQLDTKAGGRAVAELKDPGHAVCIAGFRTMYELATAALADGATLEETVRSRQSGHTIDILAAGGQAQLLAPVDHPDPAHLYLTGTGLTHMGSAESRDRMHSLEASGGAMTDSMRMFLDGLKGGKPAGGATGSQPEWFYKGDGSIVVNPGAPLVCPPFALDGGEEPEIAGIYLIDAEGNPCRLGYCLANEFSDHVTERANYLWLAHSKLRQASLGPELTAGAPLSSIRGTSRILRGGEAIWEKPFLTGEEHMSHTIANLEFHHFKYALFRRPGDLHVHFFGCPTLSFADGIQTQIGDVFEIRAEEFWLPLRNPLAQGAVPAFTMRSI